jgi:hypothetical protein
MAKKGCGNGVCTNHRRPSFKWRTVFGPITGLLLGHQKKCSHSVIGRNGCSVIKSSLRHVIAKLSSASCLELLRLGQCFWGEAVIPMQLPQDITACSKLPGCQKGCQGCLADGPSLKTATVPRKDFTVINREPNCSSPQRLSSLIEKMNIKRILTIKAHINIDRAL